VERNAVKHLFVVFLVFSVAEVVKTLDDHVFGAENLDDLRYEMLHSVAWSGVRNENASRSPALN
jgi:hypothetical protein